MVEMLLNHLNHSSQPFLNPSTISTILLNHFSPSHPKKTSRPSSGSEMVNSYPKRVSNQATRQIGFCSDENTAPILLPLKRNALLSEIWVHLSHQPSCGKVRSTGNCPSRKERNNRLASAYHIVQRCARPPARAQPLRSS